ncbi:MAG: M23 family metallopeptidase [Alphaproteobacteria bacterium]|nr:M23 family metallopeptidase [Alphaproteobacteria bacterium]
MRERERLDELFSGAGGAPLWQGFIRPVDDPLGSPFGLRRILNGKPRSPHSGVDFRSPRGTGIKAPARGRVVLVDDLFFTGRTVVLDHGAGLYSYYAHLEEPRCRTGETLAAGTVLGTVGSSGRATGPHLHWGVKLRGKRVDPLAVIALLGGEKP